MRASKLPEYPGATSRDILFRINDIVSLHVFEFSPVKPSGNIPIVVITGLVTIVDSFNTILKGLTEKHPVIYIETRDKTSSVITGDAEFNLKTMSEDVATVIRETVGNKDFAMLGFSMGGPIIAESIQFLEKKPDCVIFMEPTAEFNYPEWSLLVIRYLSLPLYRIITRFAKWYLGRTLINVKEDGQMMAISAETIDNAEKRKFRKTILTIAGYKIYDTLPVVKCPALIVGTSKDGFHAAEGMQKMLGILENGSYVDLVTNERTHSMEMVNVVTEFIRNITVQQEGK